MDVDLRYCEKAGKAFALLLAKNSRVFLGCPVLKGPVELVDKGQWPSKPAIFKGKKLAA